MLLLACDTSGKSGSISLAQCDPDGSCVVLETVPLEGGAFSAQLVPQIAALLAKHQFGKGDLDAFAVVSGPGSFTGLRVGLAAIKAMTEVLGKPLAAVSLLEALASLDEAAGGLIAALDAGRNELYALIRDQDGAKTERLLTRDELLTAAIASRVVTPDSAIAELIRSAGLPVREVQRPRSDTIACLGWKKILACERVSAEDLEANYIRRSDAEIFHKSGA